MMIEQLPVGKINFQHGGHWRDINANAVARYVEVLKDGGDMDPIEVMRDTAGNLWPVHGRHRLTAYTTAGRKTIPAVVTDGSRADARIATYRPFNEKNGEPETQEAKRIRIQEALADNDLAKWSDRKIAEHVGASNKTIAKYRETGQVGNSSPDSTPVERVGKDGKSYPAKVHREPGHRAKATPADKSTEVQAVMDAVKAGDKEPGTDAPPDLPPDDDDGEEPDMLAAALAEPESSVSKAAGIANQAIQQLKATATYIRSGLGFKKDKQDGWSSSVEGHRYTYPSTVGAINQIVRDIEREMPVSEDEEGVVTRFDLQKHDATIRARISRKRGAA